MSKKILFFFAPILFLTAFLSHAQEMGFYPLTQYSVGTRGNMQLRTTTLPQQDTLKIPYIEDFSGPGLPIDSISIDILASTDSVYRITHLKMHGLKDSDNIRVFNATGGALASAFLNGSKYVKVLNKYAFQLFNDVALTIPAKVLKDVPATVDDNERMTYCNWVRIGAEGYSSVPDTLGFLDNDGGVFINNDMAINPISLGVATFDGINYRGVPYSTGTAKGYGDNLTSLPFNLAGNTAANNIYISFYWQIKGLGDSPIASEFLALEFKNASENWVEVWREYGSNQQDTFKLARVAITNTSYLHKGFQYRFRSYGVLNGRYNVWNLDYIYINKDRSTSEPKLQDISIIRTSKSALKNYTSVPYKHIRSLLDATIKAETDSASMTIRDSLNPYPTVDDPIFRQHLVRDNLGNNPILYEQKGEISEQKFIFTQNFTNTIPGTLMTAPYALKEEFFFQTLDTLGPIDMSFNNFAAIETYFYDYYSYDDGTPEVAFLSINAGGIKVANGYKILKKDSLTHIDYCFIRHNGPDLTNSTLTLNVWKHDSATSAPSTTALVAQQIAIQYGSDINGYARYALSTPFLLDSGITYYFGYTQFLSYPLFLGHDRNNDHLDQIFFCIDGNIWQPISDIPNVPGSLMIRPVFSDNEIITSISDKSVQQQQFTFYPNPATNELHFTGQPEYITVYDVSGLLLLEKKVEAEEILSTETLQNGLYLVILSKGDYQEVKRLIIQK